MQKNFSGMFSSDQGHLSSISLFVTARGERLNYVTDVIPDAIDCQGRTFKGVYQAPIQTNAFLGVGAVYSGKLQGSKETETEGISFSYAIGIVPELRVFHSETLPVGTIDPSRVPKEPGLEFGFGVSPILAAAIKFGPLKIYGGAGRSSVKTLDTATLGIDNQLSKNFSVGFFFSGSNEEIGFIAKYRSTVIYASIPLFSEDPKSRGSDVMMGVRAGTAGMQIRF